MAAKMNRVAAVQEGGFEGRNGDAFRLQFFQGGRKPVQVLGGSQHHDIRVATKLRRAVKHAGLPPHQQVTDAVPAQGRKDFENRVRGQANLLQPSRTPTASDSLANVPTVSADTIPSIPRRRYRPRGHRPRLLVFPEIRWTWQMSRRRGVSRKRNRTFSNDVHDGDYTTFHAREKPAARPISTRRAGSWPPKGTRPTSQDAAPLEPEIIMQRPRRVLVHHKA